MKIVTLKRKIFLAVIALMGVSLIAIGYNGVGGKAIDHTPKAAVTASAPIVTKENQSSKENNNIGPKDGYFIEYRLDRERTRGQQVQWLKEIIDNPQTDAETRKKSQNQLYMISSNIGKEMETENLIRAKGFQDAIVLIQEKSITVVVKAKELTSEEAAKIAEVVANNTGIAMSNITIIPKL